MRRKLLLRLSLGLLIVLLVFVVVSTVIVTVTNFTAAPFLDQWMFLSQYREMLARGLTLNWLLAPHNEHRIPIGRLLYIADLRWFGGRNIFLIVCSLVVQGIGAAVFAVLAYRTRTLQAWCGAIAAGTLLFCMSQWPNFVQGWQVTFVLAFAAAAWTVILFVEEKALIGASVALLIAVLSLSGGILAGASGVVGSVLARQPPKRWLSFSVVTATTGTLYFVGFQRPPGHMNYVLNHIVDWVMYICLFLGGLFAPLVGPLGAFWAGLIGLGLVVVATVSVTFNPEPKRAALVALAGFVVATAAIVGLGRVQFGPAQALAGRYTTAGAYFWAALAMFAAITPWPKKIQGLAVAPALLAAVCAAVVLPACAERAANWSGDMEAGSARLIKGDTDGAVAIIGNDEQVRAFPEKNAASAQFLRENHLSVFKDH